MLFLSDKKKKALKDGIVKHKEDIKQILNAERPLEAVSEDLIKELLIDAFGYKKTDLHLQERVVKTRVDIFISNATKTGIMCECKRYNARKSELDKERAHDQLQKYCKKQCCEWGILTDAVRWQFYRDDVKHNELQLVAEASFADINKRSVNDGYAERFFIFHSDVKETERKAYADKQNVLSNEKLYWFLHCKEVQDALCKQIRKRSNVTGYKNLKQALHDRINEMFPIQGPKPYERKKKQNKKQEETK